MSNKVVYLGNKNTSQVQTLESKEIYLDLATTSLRNVSKNTSSKSSIKLTSASIKNTNSEEASSTYTITKNINVQAVQGSLKNIFNWIQGERVLLPEFGSRLRKLLYEGITQYNKEQIMAEIQHCVSQWEPRVSIVQVVDIGTIEDTEDNTVHLQIQYSIPGLSDQIYSYDFQTTSRQ